MNEQLQQFARDELKKGLLQLPEGHQMTFKRMYSHKDLEKNINEVVDDMTADKLDHAMKQVQNSIHKLEKSKS